MKATIIYAFISLLLVTTVLAVTPPTLVGTADLNLPVTPSYYITEPIANNAYAITYSTGASTSSCYTDVYQLPFGLLLFRDTNTPSSAGQCRPQSISYVDGWLSVTYRYDGVSASYPRNHVEVYDVSDLSFIESVNVTYTLSSGSVNSFASAQIIDTAGLGIDLTLIDWIGTFPYTDYLLQMSSSGGWDYNTLYEGRIYTVIDYLNQVGTVGTTFYDFSQIDNQTVVDSIVAGSIVDYDRNPANPQYITADGKIVDTGGASYDDIRVTGTSLDFTPVFIINSSYILGVENGKWVVGDMSEPITPERYNTTVTALNYRTGAQARNDRTTERLFLFNISNQEVSVYSFPLPEFVTPDENNPPIYNLEFLGVDADRNNFVFKVGFTDADGGRVYQGIDINKFPDDFYDESVNYLNEFNTLQLISEASSEDFPSCEPSLTYSSVGPSGYPTGAVTINESCLAPLYVTMPFDVQADLLTFSSPVTIRTQFTIRDSLTGNVVPSSFSLTDSLNRYLINLLFDTYINGSDVLLNVSYVNTAGVDVPILNAYNMLSYGKDYRVYAEIDFENQQITFRVTDTINTIIINDTTIPFVGEDIQDVKYINYGEYRGDGILYVDYYRLQYDSDTQFPEYRLFGSVQPNVELFNAVLAPIPGNKDYATYQATLFGTDDGFGLNYHENPVIKSFVYSSTTPALTDGAINQLISHANSNAPVELIEGDWLSSLYAVFELYGIKSQGSRFIIGLLLWILIAMPIARYAGAELGIVAGAIGFIVLASIGLFPTWFIIVVIIISGAMVAVAFRKLMGGGGG